MDTARLEEIKKWYFTYISGYQTDGEFPPKQQIKHEHSLRVADEAKSLAEEMGWTPKDIGVAYALGLLHDIGRFSQFAEFGTLVDHQSIDHAERGVEVLERENALSDLEEPVRRIISDAIRWHNRKAVPSECPSSSRRYVELIRDADKLDGFWIMHQALAVRTNKIYEDLFIGKSFTAPSTPELTEIVRQKKMITYADVKSVADYLLLQIGWIYDVNYAATMRKIKTRRVIEDFLRYCPDDAGIALGVRAALEYRDDFLKK